MFTCVYSVLRVCICVVVAGFASRDFEGLGGLKICASDANHDSPDTSP